VQFAQGLLAAPFLPYKPAELGGGWQATIPTCFKVGWITRSPVGPWASARLPGTAESVAGGLRWSQSPGRLAWAWL